MCLLEIFDQDHITIFSAARADELFPVPRPVEGKDEATHGGRIPPSGPSPGPPLLLQIAEQPRQIGLLAINQFAQRVTLDEFQCDEMCVPATIVIASSPWSN